MIKNVLSIMSLVLMLSGCTAKEFEDGAAGIGDDVSKLFEVRE